MTMLPQEISTDVLLEKYTKLKESSIEEVYRRVSKGIAIVEKTTKLRKHWEEVFYNNMLNGGIGAGRIMSAGGAGIDATLINCFVQPVGDAIQGVDRNGVIGIYEALREAAETMRRGGGVGYDFSLIRPKNSKVGNFGARASGPCSYMNIFNSSCSTIESAGARRGAQMGVLKWHHPDILDFIKAKRTPGTWNNFNISVYVTDDFMKAKANDEDVQLFHKVAPSEELQAEGAFQREDGNWVYRTVKATWLWDIIMKSNYDFAEPGILFGDTINNDNNLRYCEVLEATNPCGEQPLPNYGCCDLGPIILTKFVKFPFTPKAVFDYEAFKKVVAIQVRFLDNVLIATRWPLEQQQKDSDNKRRIGVGFTGLGNTLAMLRMSYASDDAITTGAKIAETMRDAAYMASVELAQERGTFPLFNADKYLEKGTFASRLPNKIKAAIRKYGIRNSHLLSIAPTGTISLAFADNASNGIEPPFSLAYTRNKRMGDGTTKIYPVIDHGLRVWLSTLHDQKYAKALLDCICSYKTSFVFEEKEYLIEDMVPEYFSTAMNLTPSEHLVMMEAVQPFIDSAISKTVNVPADCDFEYFKQIYNQAYMSKLKGVSTYRPNAILGSVLTVGVTEEAPKAVITASLPDINPNTVMISKRPSGRLNSITDKIQYHGHNGNYTLYVSVSFMNIEGRKDGVDFTVERPIEVFINASPSSVPAEWVTTYSRTMSLIARSGLPLFTKALQDNRSIASGKHQIRYDWHHKADGTKVPRHHDSDVAVISYAIQNLLKERGILDENGNIATIKQIKNKTSISTIINDLVTVSSNKETIVDNVTLNIVPGSKCDECGALAVIKADGCSKCTACGHIGSCG